MLEAGNQGWGRPEGLSKVARTTSQGCQPSSPCHHSLCDPGQSLSLGASLPCLYRGNSGGPPPLGEGGLGSPEA